MGVDGLRWALKVSVGIESLRWVCMGWDGCIGAPGNDLDGIEWYGRSGTGIGGLGCMTRAWDL